MNGVHDFKAFKSQIDLVQFATSIGFEIDRAKSTRNSIVMFLDSCDRIVVSKRNGLWMYFSVYDDQDNGTIIDFLTQRTQLSFAQVGQRLAEWLNSEPKHQEPSIRKSATDTQYDPIRIDRIFNTCTNAKTHSYLERRGISRDVLCSPTFKDQIFKDCYGNAVFPHRKHWSVCGLELKGNDISLFARGSEKTLWRSNFTRREGEMVVGESPIDVLSYYELFRKEAAYFATSGGFSKAQGHLLIEVSKYFQHLSQITLITDNDKGGDTLTSRLLSLFEALDIPIKRHSPPDRGLDWNNELTQLKQKGETNEYRH